ncbi:uncharacterized protein I303_105356 [Kwoniella dejecticola CBS 10117]|uniref:Protein CPL1-like domain-containing protein n=1 Tax=Kwoniella dejecticola CBS 10117 TaxID=1296121 RepID=A0A1A6A2Q7_9TREE|nr:uncharacterized protein I303_05197 [Kwoniella dejecticola CBS 10117]OBR84339.1 hypothetical protein I303_05197 [Kwoniella dejecticola CBS 10117]
MSIKSIIITLPLLLFVSVSAQPTSSTSHNLFLGCTDPLSTPIRPLRVNADSLSSCVEACGSSASRNTFAYWLGGGESSCVCSPEGPAEEYDIAYPREGASHCDDHEVAVIVTKSGHSFNHQPKRAGRSGRNKRSVPVSSPASVEERDNSSAAASCPQPLKACQVSGDATAYQCIDPQFALNSCGGCIHGNFGGSSSASAVDCTKIEGVAEGGVICSSGQCKAYRCLDGYKLNGNTCVKA